MYALVLLQLLTSDEVARRAEATSFDVAARAREVEAAQAALDQAEIAYWPRLSVGARYVRLSDITQPLIQIGDLGLRFPVLLDQTTFSASLTVPLSDDVLRIGPGRQAALDGRGAAQSNERATRAKTAADARVLYWSWVKARLQVDVAEQSVVQARQHLTDVRNLLAAGTVSRADALRVESQLAAAELLATRTRDLADVLEDQIRTVMHLAGDGALQVGEAVGEPNLPEGQARELLGEARQKRLELRALDEQTAALDQQVKIARAGSWPRLDAFGEALYANPNPRFFPQQDRFDATWDVGVQLTYSPNDLANAEAARRQAIARAAELRAERAALEDAIRNEVVQAWEAARDAAAALDSTARGLTAAEESYRVRRELFREGRATSVELTDAETEVTRARMEAAAARADLRIARVRLDHATGRDLR